jgi:hypothetical protein
MKKLLILSFFCFGFAFAANSQTVYASEKGEKYHTADCKLSGDAAGMKLADAKKKGKGQCAICKPDDHAKDKVSQCTGKTADKSQCKRMTASKTGKCYQHVAAK